MPHRTPSKDGHLRKESDHPPPNDDCKPAALRFWNVLKRGPDRIAIRNITGC